MNAPEETAQMVYERILRRRARLAGTVAGGRPLADDAGAQARAAASRQAGTAEAVFGQVASDTRTGRPSAPSSPGTGSEGSRPLRVDEILFEEPAEPAPRPSLRHPAPAAEIPGRGEATVGGTFPRSATMRLVLKHPALLLGLGVPAAGVLLRYPGSRRLLGAALSLGVRPEIQQLVKLSAAAAKRSASPQVRPAQAAPEPPAENAPETGPD